MTIHILADEVISQIAAGEVVERPASVVKELVENALDANASAISIRILDSGLKLIEIADDGDGIPYDEIKMALTRHATSKLQNASDLFAIHTLGFRGEALASIASVARLTISSRVTEAEFGGRVLVDGGKMKALEAVGVPKGTVIQVENLFFNVPPRLDFLKSPATEKNRINALVNRYALAYPNVRWQLYQDNRPVLRSSGNGDRREILASMYGVQAAKDMIEVNLKDRDYHVFGYISPAELTRSNRRELSFFVNGRWVNDVGLSTALLRAYDHTLPQGRYPIAVLFVELDPELVDVNVHPSKAEVRFRDTDQMFTVVQRAVRRAFMAFTPLESRQGSAHELDQGKTAGETLPRSAALHTANHEWGHFADHSGQRQIDPAWELARRPREEEESAEGGAGKTTQDRQSALFAESIGLLRLIGEMKDRFLLAEGPDGLYLIDEYAASEQILYESFLRLVGRFETYDFTELDRPPTFQVEDSFLSLMPEFEQLGFHFEEFGPDTVRLRRAPNLFDGIDLSRVLRQVIELLPTQRFAPPESGREWLLMICCRFAGEQYHSGGNKERQEQMLSRLQACLSPRQTNDGRAIMVHLSLDVLNRQFGRS